MPEGVEGEKHKKKGADWHHAHFGIKFTEYESGEKFFGYDRLVLKWFKGDPGKDGSNFFRTKARVVSEIE